MDSDPLTNLLQRATSGDHAAAERLYDAVYADLHRRAELLMAHQPAQHTLQPTAVVNEAWLRLGLNAEVDWQDRSHFLAVASRAMRSVLVDHARRRTADRRGGGRRRVEWDEALEAFEAGTVDLLELDEALSRLGEMDAQLARIVELRFFGGLTIAEAARVLDVSTPTIERGWRSARIWLRAELGDREEPGPDRAEAKE